MKLTVNNSFSRLLGFTKSQFTAIRNELSVKSINYGYCYLTRYPSDVKINASGIWVKDAKGESRALTNRSFRRYKNQEAVNNALRNKSPVIYRGYIKQQKPLIDSKGVFPTGLLKRLLALGKTNGWQIEVEDQRQRPELSEGILLRPKYPHTPYPEQSEAAAACAEASRGIIVASTGVGKSLIIAQIIANLQVKTLVVVPSLELKRQLTESLQLIYGTSYVGNQEENRHITVENVQSVNPGNYKCLILDEFHRAASATYQKLNATAWKDIYYRFGVTATAFRNKDSEDILLEGILSEVIYDLPYTKAVEKGYVVPLQAFYIEVPVTPNVSSNDWDVVYNKLIVNNTVRNALIYKMLDNLRMNGASTLCLVKEILHGQILSYPNLAGSFPFANGQDGKASRLIIDFNYKKHPVLIGTQGVLGEGVDTKPCEFLVLAGIGKSEPALMQAFGRCFRNYPGKEIGTVILFRDASHRFTLTHFEEQCRVLKDQYNVVPKELVI